MQKLQKVCGESKAGHDWRPIWVGPCAAGPERVVAYVCHFCSMLKYEREDMVSQYEIQLYTLARLREIEQLIKEIQGSLPKRRRVP